MLLTAKEFKEVFLSWAGAMEANRDYLIELDGVAGDSDLGLSMNDGFGAVRGFLETFNDPDLGNLFYYAGKTMASSAPSSLGTLIASGFMQVGKALKGATSLELYSISSVLEALEAGMIQRGKAKLGEKTFLDGLHPAILVLQSAEETSDLALLLKKAEDASREGADSTVNMVAKHGRAAVRGELSVGLLDPGAIVASLMVSAMCETLLSLM